MNPLDSIDSPADLKRLPMEELPAVAEDIRGRIIDVVSKTGGHLASSLGAVELAVALHYVFDTPGDRIIWDVGHQAYAHKLLTGRKDRFHTLRRENGLSGFTKTSESPHDAFSTGHSSTSISAGLGMAIGKSLKKDSHKVVCVIGDGSMTAGLAYEGLNQTGHLKKDLIVILNDNDMSISPNVGALSSFLSRKFSAKFPRDFRQSVKEFLKSLPRIGDDMYHLAKRWEDSIKTFVTPGMLFEAFNFEYFGPINGHNLDHLVDILLNIKHMQGPILLHVTTKKGKGYAPAEKNPTYYHGVGCFEVDTGICIVQSSPVPTYTKVFGDAMVELAEKDEEIVAVTAAMPEGTGLARFAETYPDRFFDAGIAEQHGVTFAAGLAAEGFKPVVAVYSTFLQRAYDQILHDVCLEGLPVVFAVDRGGMVGEDGPTHHGLFDFAYLRSIPNMVVMAPKDENELRRILATSLAHDGPAAFRYPRGTAVGVPLEAEIRPLPLGRSEVLKDGKDVLLLAVGGVVADAVTAAETLAEKGIDAGVVNCRFVKPFDVERILPLAAAVKEVVTIEDHVLMGGFGGAVLEAFADHGLADVSVCRIGVPDTFVAHGPKNRLKAAYDIDADGIVRTVERRLDRRALPRISRT